ncbi:riboflavin kinase [Ascobolus immersus RN42]|uniref:Riboflavin kinase n=1 Tax=Ascobolus immersus RN42 TaxID=1160509 RepID=A0A3N4HDS5_ASCIM|nr:riboflavin kinase [Ascobolus immersus RN42]
MAAPPKSKLPPIPTSERPTFAGPESPESPFPIRVSGPIIKGFGRGSSSLGIPTANIPIAGLDVGGNSSLESGVYYGYAAVPKGTGAGKPEGTGEAEVWDMCMSVGWNPFYQNERRSVEVHIIHKFPKNFYGAPLKILVLGFIRPEYDYKSLEALIDDINFDVTVTENSLKREAYAKLRSDEWLRRVDDVDMSLKDEEPRPKESEDEKL